MTKAEFLKKIKTQKIQTGEYLLVLDHISDAQYIIGCVFDQGVWKIYKSNERGGHYVIRDFEEVNQAFDYFYEFILNKFYKNKKIHIR